MVGTKNRNRVVVGITGASGVVYGFELVKALADRGQEVHLIASDPGWQLLSMELGVGREEMESLTGHVYNNDELDSPLSSGSYIFDSMAIAPCSMRTLGAIASGSCGSLIARAAEVCLKERRRLVLVTRETPLSLVQIRNMETATLAGAVVLPASPGFYHRPKTVEDMVSHVVGKVLDQLGIEHDLFRRWEGVSRKPGT